MPVPRGSFTTPSMNVRIVSAVAGSIARLYCCTPTRETTLSLGSSTQSTKCGCRIDALVRDRLGDERHLHRRDEHLVLADRVLHELGLVVLRTCPGAGPVLATIGGSMPEPSSARRLRSARRTFWMPVANVSPRSKPTCAYVVLHDTMKPSSSDAAALLAGRSCSSGTPFVCGQEMWSTTGNFVSTSTLFCSAIDAVTVLNVEPGG